MIDKILDSFDDVLSGNCFDPSYLPSFHVNVINELCLVSIRQLSRQPSLLEVDPNIVVVGDIHGNFEDIHRIFRLFERPPATNYIFLGDYVDRGPHSFYCITLLLALQAKYPNNVYLLRGNHEFSIICKTYGFAEELFSIYGRSLSDQMFTAFNEVFGYMPIAAVIGGAIFCVHGGLSPRLNDVESIRSISRPIVSFEQSPITTDLVWSDPGDIKDDYAPGVRGRGVTFGPKATAYFLARNKLKMLIRAHQFTSKGVHSFAGNLGITVFSSSNYRPRLPNKCGVIKVEETGDLYFYCLDGEPESEMNPRIMALDGRMMGLQRCSKTVDAIPDSPMKKTGGFH